jgi:hypothetical protein
MVKLYRHSGQLALVSSRSDGGSGVTGQHRASGGTHRPTSPRCPASGNEPNFGRSFKSEVSSVKRDTRVTCAKQSQFGRSRMGTHDPRRADQATSPRCPASGNKANFGERAGHAPGANYAKQSQLPPWRQEGQRLARKRVMVNGTSDRPRQNKANFGKPGWDPGSRLCKTKPIWRRGRSCDIASMPRFGKQSQLAARPRGWDRGPFPGRLRKTKPIWRSSRGWSLLCDIASMPRFGKQSQFGGKWLKEKGLWWIGRPDGSTETNPLCCGQMRQTKPILRLRIAD